MWLQAASLSYLGLFFGISVVIGLSCGSYLDNRLHTTPWLRIVGVLFGLATGFNELYRIAKRYQRQQRAAAQASPDPDQPALLQNRTDAGPAVAPPTGLNTDPSEAEEDRDSDEKAKAAKAAQEEEDRARKDSYV